MAHRAGDHGGAGQFTRHVVLKQADGYAVAQDFLDEGEGFAGSLPPGFANQPDVIAYFQRGDGLALPLPKDGQDVIFQHEAVAFRVAGAQSFFSCNQSAARLAKMRRLVPSAMWASSLAASFASRLLVLGSMPAFSCALKTAWARRASFRVTAG